MATITFLGKNSSKWFCIYCSQGNVRAVMKDAVVSDLKVPVKCLEQNISVYQSLMNSLILSQAYGHLCCEDKSAYVSVASGTYLFHPHFQNWHEHYESCQGMLSLRI